MLSFPPCAAMESSTPTLTHLATLESPGGPSTRLWQSSPHPSSSHPLLATASSDKSVHIHSLTNFQLLSTISGGHKRSVRCVEWKDYGRPSKRSKLSPADTEEKRSKVTLATGSFDANVGIWDHNQQQNNNTTTTTTTDPDTLETDINEDTDQEEWHFSTLLTGPDSEIKSIKFSPPHYSANLLATSSRDKSVWVWEEVEDDEWETIAVLQEHTGDVKCVAWCEGAQAPPPPPSTNSTPHDANGVAETENENNASRIVGSREILASSSYDDTIRFFLDSEAEGDWICVGLIEGHEGTVWSVAWEKHIDSVHYPSAFDYAADWEPRLLSCSDDRSIRVWRRELSESEKEKKRQNRLSGSGANGTAHARHIPSIIRPSSEVEAWVEEARLPSPHVRSIYAVDWSRKTGLVVSCGGDGTIAVYKEVAASSASGAPVSAPSAATSSGMQVTDADGDTHMNGNAAHTVFDPSSSSTTTDKQSTTWRLVAIQEFAHNEYEINHVCWAPRRDKDRRFEDEQVIVSTGDDGKVKLWVLPEM